jgi:hypothetical protein
LRERKTGPDGLDSKDAEGGAALGDPTSMRSWLSCHDIVEEVFFKKPLLKTPPETFLFFRFLQVFFFFKITFPACV